MAYTPDLSRLLTPGARYADEHDEYVIEPHPIGDVTFPTGQVVGCDPLTADDAVPFTVGVTPGAYPLRAWVAVLYRGGAEQQRRVAVLQLVVRDEPAVRWEPAVVERLHPGSDTRAAGTGRLGRGHRRAIGGERHPGLIRLG